MTKADSQDLPGDWDVVGVLTRDLAVVHPLLKPLFTLLGGTVMACVRACVCACVRA